VRALVLVLGLAVCLFFGTPAGAVSFRQQATTPSNAVRAHPRVRLVVHVPRCATRNECVVTLFRHIIPTPTNPSPGTKVWAKAAYVRHHRAVFHLRRSRTRGLSFTFGGGETPYFSDVVLRWWHVKPDSKQDYRPHHRHRNEGGWCWAGTSKRRVDLTIRLQYIVADAGATPETVARVWLARAVKLTMPITKFSRMKQGVSFHDTAAGQRCTKNVIH
jgi:hypothetical protein